jgi:hypothetical protein
MESYFSFAEQVGSMPQWSSQQKEEMLNANINNAAVQQSDGTVLDGYNQLRLKFVTVHVKVISDLIDGMVQPPYDKVNEPYVRKVSAERDKLLQDLSSISSGKV